MLISAKTSRFKNLPKSVSFLGCVEFIFVVLYLFGLFEVFTGYIIQSLWSQIRLNLVQNQSQIVKTIKISVNCKTGRVRDD